MSIRVDRCPIREQHVVIVPLRSEMSMLRQRMRARRTGEEERIDHFAIVGFRDETEARAWHPGQKAHHLRIVGPFSALTAPACDIGCC